MGNFFFSIFEKTSSIATAYRAGPNAGLAKGSYVKSYILDQKIFNKKFNSNLVVIIYISKLGVIIK